MVLAVLFSLTLMQRECYAKNYYAYCVYEFTDKTDKKIHMNVITKTFDEKSGKATANSNPKRQGKWVLIGTDCVRGNEYDKNFAAVFNNQPVMGVYLSYANLDGFETRIMFVGVTGNNSPLPGYPIDIPTEVIMPTINTMKQQLESRGLKNIKIIYPKTK